MESLSSITVLGPPSYRNISPQARLANMLLSKASPGFKFNLNRATLYFFFSENIHEVPPVVGEKPRIVLAAFFGMSPDDEEIFVWS